jgi:hypothetical protein
VPAQVSPEPQSSGEQKLPRVPGPIETQTLALPFQRHRRPAPHPVWFTGSHGKVTQLPAVLQVCGEVHVPQLPVQLSEPHTRPEHCAVHAAHWPVPLHKLPGPQVPQLPPHPSAPHTLPAQFGTH